VTRLRVAIAAAVVTVLAVGLIAGGAFLGLSGAPRTAAGPPTFVDETAAAGLLHRFDGDAAYAVGGGVAVFDCDGDGFPDAYLAGGAGAAALFRNTGTVGGPLRFERVDDSAAGLDAVEGAYPIDLDGDDLDDLVVLRVGETQLLRGLGDCRFEPANDALGFDGASGQGTAFSATWEGSATLPTLAIGRYLTIEPDGSLGTDCDTHVLLRPSADGASYGPPTTLAPGYCTLSMLFSDWDRSGRRDLRVTNDRHYYVDGMDQLWRIAPGEAPRAYTGNDGWVSMQIWGMGIASQDVTADGFPEVFLTSQGDNKLQTLTSGAEVPTYRDIALRRGVTAARPFAGGDVLPSTAWHPAFDDVNDDGLVDLFVSKGNVSAQPDFAARDPSNLLLGQADGTFVEAADRAGILSFERGRGAAVADFNLDGLPDLLLVNYGADAILWRNVGGGQADAPATMGGWLALRLEQQGANRDGVGSWIEVRVGDVTQTRELTIGGGHLSGQLGWIHFGLGAAERAEVRVEWPDGEVGPWQSVTADQFIVIERGSAEPRPWQPPN
jgi:hypothetical protein